MSLKTLILDIFLFSPLAGLTFRALDAESGFFLPSLKNKAIGYRFGEDAFATSPFVVALSDGVSKSEFPACHLAITLTHSVVGQFHRCISHHYFFMNTNMGSPCSLVEMTPREAFLTESIIPHLYHDHYRVIQVANEKDIEDIQSLPLEKYTSSATFIGGFITPSQDPYKSILNLFQKGDSLALLLRFDEQTKNWKPYMYTNEHQFSFNYPHQFSSVFKEKINFENDYQLTVDLKPFDILILGSDGIFDNLPMSIIAYAVNYYFKELIESKNDHWKTDPRVVFRRFLEKYKSMIDRGMDNGLLDDAYDLEHFGPDFKPKTKLKKESSDDLSSLMRARIGIRKKESEINEDEEVDLRSLMRPQVFIPNQNEEQSGGGISPTKSNLGKSQLHDEETEKLLTDLKLNPSDNVINEESAEDKNKIKNSFASDHKSKNSELKNLGKSTNPLDFIPENNKNLHSEAFDADEFPQTDLNVFEKRNSLAKESFQSQNSMWRKRTFSNINEPEEMNFRKPEINIERLNYLYDIYTEKCEMINIFREFQVPVNEQVWNSEWAQYLIDPCMTEVINNSFEFDEKEFLQIVDTYDPRLISEAIVHLSKDFTVTSENLVSPFWVRSRVDPDYKRLPPMGKDDDMTIIVTLLENVSIDSSTYSDTKYPSAATIYQRFFDLREQNVLKLEQDVLFTRRFPNGAKSK